MIHYALKCARGHGFDGWFGSSSAFDEQQQSGLLACPFCGTPDVSRALMSPAVRTHAAKGPAEPQAEDEPAPESRAPTPASEPLQQPTTDAALPMPMANPASLPDIDRERFITAVRAMREAVVKHGTNVGTAFPEEARRIHYGEAEPRGIYGSAAPEEAEALIEEGIEILPIPTLPEDRN